MEQTKYDVFISYSRHDYVDENENVIPNNEVSKIMKAFTDAGITYWIDKDGIYSGDKFTEELPKIIKSACIFVYLSTANANKSKYTSKEIAIADEYGKDIIPVRIDMTPYSDNVIFRIADVSYIKYAANPEKGREDLVMSIKSYLRREKEKRENELKKAEEEKRIREQEMIRIAQEQERLVSEITLACKKLNIDEKKIELERENLLLDVLKVNDAKQQAELKSLIKESSPIRLKYQIEELPFDTQQTEVRPTENEDFYNEEDFIIYLTIDGTEYEEIEVRVTDTKKTIRNQVKSIVSVFELPEKDKEGNSIQYLLGVMLDGEPVILEFEDEDGHEQTFLDYDIQSGDHLHIISVKIPKSGTISMSIVKWGVILLLAVVPTISMMIFNQDVAFTVSRIQLVIIFSLACVGGIVYIFWKKSTKRSNN